MPGLVTSALEREVETDLDEPVVGPEDSFGDGRDPGVGHEIEEAADLLGIDLDVPPPATAADRSMRSLDGRPEGGHQVLVEPFDPFPGKRPLATDDPVTLDRLDVGVDGHVDRGSLNARHRRPQA